MEKPPLPLTDHQRFVLETYLQLGDKQAVANKLGMSRSSVRNTLAVAESKGFAPWFTPAPRPEHLAMGKTTVQYNAAGEAVQEWRRLHPTAQMMQDVVDGLCEQARGKGKLKWRLPKKTDTDDLLFELDIYDAHVGMYADERETLDENYDCDIAARRMVEAAAGIASRARRPGKVVLVFGGDMMHMDNRSNRTEISGNALDVDTRYHRVVSYLIAASREVVQIAASIGASVEVVVLEGNHSWVGEVWLAQVLAAYYSNEPRVTVHLKQSPRRMMVFGDNLLVWAHGDRIAAAKWAQIIAAEFSREWGTTKFRYLKCGHIHHNKTIAPVVVEEQAGLHVEYLPALCATDDWHARSGFVGSQRGATGFEFHKKVGCITRFFHAV